MSIRIINIHSNRLTGQVRRDLFRGFCSFSKFTEFMKAFTKLCLRVMLMLMEMLIHSLSYLNAIYIYDWLCKGRRGKHGGNQDIVIFKMSYHLTVYMCICVS